LESVNGMALLRNVGVVLRTWLIVVILWWIAAKITANSLIVPTPWQVLKAISQMIGNGEIFRNIWTSLSRLLTGFAIASVLGVSLGFMMGLSAKIRSFLENTIEIFRPIAGIAWIPLLLVLVGIGTALPVMIVFYGCFFPILFNTIMGVRTVDPVLMRAAASMCVSKRHLISQVVAYSALPYILTGMRTALGLGWMSIVAGEMFGSSAGLGYAVAHYQDLLQTSKLFAAILVIGLLGLMMDALMRYVQKRLAPWDNRDRSVSG